VIENKENKKLSWAVTDDGLSFGVLIFSDKVLENYTPTGFFGKTGRVG
jgi:hypothetical protein